MSTKIFRFFNLFNSFYLLLDFVASKMPRRSTTALRPAAQVNVPEEVLGRTQTARTSTQYLGYLRKFFAVLELGEEREFTSPTQIPTEYFVDKHIAAFLLSLGESCEWRESQKKSAMAALNDQLRNLGKPNIYDFSHEYPLSHSVLARWVMQMKTDPKHPKRAGIFSPQACDWVIANYPLTEAVHFQHRAFFAMTCFGAMRVEDVDRTHSEEVSLVSYDAELDIPRW